jgi:hypothetical protein
MLSPSDDGAPIPTKRTIRASAPTSNRARDELAPTSRPSPISSHPDHHLRPPRPLGQPPHCFARRGSWVRFPSAPLRFRSSEQLLADTPSQFLARPSHTATATAEASATSTSRSRGERRNRTRLARGRRRSPRGARRQDDDPPAGRSVRVDGRTRVRGEHRRPKPEIPQPGVPARAATAADQDQPGR